MPKVDELTSDELTELLRIKSTAKPNADLCALDDLDLRVLYLDAALGHRFGKITATNISQKTCNVQGFPGFGARGEWGHKSLLVAEQSDPITSNAEQELIRLTPGDTGYANMEWSGSLGGAESEPISAFLVQLSQNQTPAIINRHLSV